MGDSSDEELFRAAMDGVAPLTTQRSVPDRKPAEPTIGQLQRRRDAVEDRRNVADPNYLHLGEVKPVHPLEVIEWKKDGVQPEVFHKLKTGRYPVEATLDLHRKTVKEARVAVFQFLELCNKRGWRSVLITHGRGEKSATPGRLKSYVNHWMSQVDDVIAYSSAPRWLGGVGALFVLLKKSKDQKEENRERHGLKSSE